MKVIRLLKRFNIRYPQFKSLNIYPTDYCNRRCIFCKLTGLLTTQENRADMTMKDIDAIIDFCKRSGVNEIRIFGGEPSHHPQIVDLIERVYDKGLYVGIIFTNGIFDNDELVNCIVSHHIPININYFPKEEYKDGQLELVHENMRRLFLENSRKKRMLGQKPMRDNGAALSITFYKPDQEYQYIIDTCLKYGIHNIRWAVSERAMTGKNIFVPWLKLKQMVPLLVSFVSDFATAGISNGPDCRLVVPCVLTKKELNFFLKFTDNFMPFKCYPILDVFPDLSIHYCMGMPIVSWITKNNTLNQIFLEQMIISEFFRRIPISKACLKCKWWKKEICQGYCLQFKYDKNDSRHKMLINGFDWLNNRNYRNKILNLERFD